MAARRLIFDRQNPTHRRYFTHIYEGVISGANVLLQLGLRQKSPKDGEHIWDRRADEVRLIRTLKRHSVESDTWLDPATRQHRSRQLAPAGEETIIELEHVEYQYGIKALKAGLWDAAVVDEIDDAIQFFEDAEKV